MALTTSLLLTFLVSLQPISVSAQHLSYNGLALTPQLGWDTYNVYGLDYDEDTVRTNADRLVNFGFRDLGYRVVIFDDAMTELERAEDGTLIDNAEKFPSGLKPIVDDLHSLGLQFGVYSSAGRFTCGGYPGSLGYETQDANWWASLGADYLKYDNCYNEGNSGTPKLSEHRYAIMSNALNSTGRNFTYSICNWGDDKPWEWANTISNSARMSGDITDRFSVDGRACPCGPDDYYCQFPRYSCSTLNILGKASHIISRNHPGFWNDLDMLTVGLGGQTYDEYKTQFSMWAAIKSPLIMGNKLDELSPEGYGILTNPAVLAISQDPQGSAVSRTYVQQMEDKDESGIGEIQIWQGYLSGGELVVAFLNAGNNSRTITSSLVQIIGGIRTNTRAQRSWDLYDVWGNETVMPVDIASAVLNGTQELTTNATTVQGYYNATELSFADGLASNDTRLLGTLIGTVAGGGSITADVPRHGIAMWRLRPSEGGATKRDEL